MHRRFTALKIAKFSEPSTALSTLFYFLVCDLSTERKDNFSLCNVKIDADRKIFSKERIERKNCKNAMFLCV